MNYYHLCTDGLKQSVMFRDNEDYVTGINYLAVCQITVRKIEIIAFCLMSNHLHIVAKGNESAMKKFIISFKRRYSMWLSRKYKEYKMLHRTACTIKEIDSIEYLKQVIAYVLRNPIAAGINVSPFQYKWSSASCYFSPKDENVRTKDDNSLPAYRLSVNKGRHILKTRTPIFDKITVIDGAMADLTSFVKFTEVEDIFKTFRAFMYFMSKDNDNEIELEMNLLKKVSYNDSTVINAIRQICEEKFKTSHIGALRMHEKCSLIKYLKKNFNSSPKQIARVLNLKIETIAQLY